MTYLYRYRNARRALSELEKQEIFFSKVEDLNDPMEGFKDLFWSGDTIVWRALLKHYLLCLLNTTYQAFIMGVDFEPKQIEGFVFNAPASLPEAPIREIYNALITQFLNEPAVKAFLSAVASRPEPIRRNELLGYLRALHPLAVIPLFKDMHNRGLWPGFVPPPDEGQVIARQHAIKLIEASSNFFEEKNLNSKASDGFFAAAEATMEQVLLVSQANLKDRDGKRPMVFVIGDFPRAYVTGLDRLVHGDWYVACFTGRPDNFSMWSTYGDGHKGMCFVFQPTVSESDGPVLHLNRIVGASASAGRPTVPIRNYVAHPVHPVNYSREYPSIDFFRSLGRIRQIDMNNFWYLGDDGQISACRDAVYSNEEAWREAYWKKFLESALYKTPEWEYEEEHRVTAYSAFDMAAPEERIFQFQFADLAGIVFGARTPTETKLKAMEIVSQKCDAEGRTDFKFYEARYSHDSFTVHELMLLKIQGLR